MANFVVGGTPLGQINSISHSFSGNLRDRTAVWSEEHVFAPGIPERELTVEVSGSAAFLNVNQQVTAAVTFDTSTTIPLGTLIVQDVEVSNAPDDGDTTSYTFKRAYVIGTQQ